MKNKIQNILTAAALAGFIFGGASAPRPTQVRTVTTTAATVRGQ